MDRQKSSDLKRCFLFCLTASLIALLGLPNAIEAEWETITSFKNVRRMRLINDTLWVATSGGILAITDVDSPGRKFDNLDGLGTTDITDIIEDTDGQKWVTGFGRLIKFTEGDSKQFLFEKDNSLLPLRCVIDDGDNLWVGAEVGLVLFSKTIDGGQIQDSYHQFGNLNPNPIVNDILLVGDTIWIATSSGLAVAQKTNPSRLKSPAAWTVFGIDNYPELGTEDIRRVVWFEQALYLATAKGMFRLDRSPSDTTFTRTPSWLGTWLTDLKVENDTLFFYYRYAMGAFADSHFSYPLHEGLPSSPYTGLNNGTFRWVGFSGEGIYHDRDSASLVVEYPYTGSPGNDVSDLTVNIEGVITAGFTWQKAAQYVSETWIVHDVHSSTTEALLDSSGNAWIATWGSGVWVIKEDTVVNYDETNSTMRGIPEGETYVVVVGLATDGKYIYAACYYAQNGYPIAIGQLSNLDDPSGWDSLGVVDGLSNESVGSIDYNNGRLAVGTTGGGVYVCYLGDDPFNASGRHCRHYTEDSGLISNNIRVVKFSPEGNLWVGTNFGLSRWDLDRFADVTTPPGIGPDITALEFDGRGNLWIGSKNGLARVDGTTGTSTVYTAGNSGLVSDEIANLTLDPLTGDLYVATPGGISILRSRTFRFTSQIEDVVAYPNPFIVRSQSDRLNFNFSKKGTVRLFTVAGELVAQFPVNTPWDGRNQKGQQVASGVYVYVLTDKDGKVGKGKVLLVRKE
jgi:ligand-binding sensor domain-containing protein